LFEEIERAALAALSAIPFEYAEWKTAKVHPDYHVEVDKTLYSVHSPADRPPRGRAAHPPSG
jgi:hypothetical protein